MCATRRVSGTRMHIHDVRVNTNMYTMGSEDVMSQANSQSTAPTAINPTTNSQQTAKTSNIPALCRPNTLCKANRSAGGLLKFLDGASPTTAVAAASVKMISNHQPTNCTWSFSALHSPPLHYCAPPTFTHTKRAIPYCQAQRASVLSM